MDHNVNYNIPATTLPLEIIDTIIDELHDEPVCLENCSLVSKKFVSRAQKHLFSTIRLIFPEKPTRHVALGLLGAFIDNPGLARHVQNLYLERYFEGVWDVALNDYRRITDEVLPRLFGNISSLKVFSLRGGLTGYPYMPQWRESNHLGCLSPTLIAALFRMLQTNKVAELSIQCISNFPVGLIPMTCPHLTRFLLDSLDSDHPLDHAVIYGSHLTSGDGTSSHSVLPNSRLDALQIDGGSGAAARTLYHASCSPSRLTLYHLRELVLRSKSDSMREVAADIIANAATSLETFHWDYNYDNQFEEFENGLVDLGMTTGLRFFRVAFYHDQYSEPFHLLWVSQTLAAIKGHNHLQEVVIALSYSLYEVHGDEWNECEDWASSFDQLLTGPGFGQLRRVAIRLRFYDFEGEDPPATDCAYVTKLLEEKLPLLRDSGLLSIWSATDSEGLMDGYLDFVNNDGWNATDEIV
ncbi:hypothetical protein Hypma_014401 [Hypsizygus marmoreus]|uniref:F-box domain-containing protein n=1 Tax=Hypsizygus marmoreus TaxID=39966 RepID=A0A369JCJ0_HYPMA|nr:hypothetical protein Hypma_014401 [Hypsizygus marmoreus]